MSVGKRRSAIRQPGCSTHVRFASFRSTFARVHGTNDIIGFGLNNYSQLAVPKHEDLFFNPKLTTIQNVKTISGTYARTHARLDR